MWLGAGGRGPSLIPSREKRGCAVAGPDQVHANRVRVCVCVSSGSFGSQALAWWTPRQGITPCKAIAPCAHGGGGDLQAPLATVTAVHTLGHRAWWVGMWWVCAWRLCSAWWVCAWWVCAWRLCSAWWVRAWRLCSAWWVRAWRLCSAWWVCAWRLSGPPKNTQRPCPDCP